MHEAPSLTAMRLGVLGPIVLDGVAGEVPVTGAKARQILTVLALSSPAGVTVDRLIDVVWVEPPASASKTIQAHLSRLRRALADGGAPGAIVGGRAGYQLELGDRLDVAELAKLTRRGAAALDGGDHRLAADLLGRARALWRGEPELPATPAGEALRRSLHDQRLELAIDHLGALIAAGAADDAVAELGELVAAEPLNERLSELRILALYRSGRPTEALRAYQAVAALLDEEIGVAPGPTLRALEAAILAHDDGALGEAPARIPAPSHHGDIRYARAGTTHVAYRCFGEGPTPVLLCNPGLISIDTLLEEPHMAAAIAQLSEGRQVIALDPRGMGLSDRTQAPESITVHDWVDDVGAVLDAVGVDVPHVFASGHGGLVAMAFSARYPQRVRSLTLVNPFARFTAGDDYPHGSDPEGFAAMQAGMQSTDPGPGLDALSLISPSVAADPAYRAWWDAAGRRAASPAAAAALVTTMTRVDLRHLLPAITAPCLVVVRRGCPAYDAAHGEYLADRLGDVVLERHFDVNDPWWVGDTAAILAAFDRHLASVPADLTA
jgi:DNA-binding SARP family transcriptional activator/pimeloyl-ACP methyl ester carboxylesterase